MSDTPAPRPPLDTWQAVAMRLTLFADPSELPLDSKGWWQVVTGEEPETTTERPKLAMRKDEGKFLGGTFILDVAAHRISWELQPLLDPEAGNERLFSLGTYPEVRDQFVTALSPWLRRSLRLSRLAFGCVLKLPTEDRVASYRALGDYVPVRLDPETSRDFQYRINRRRPSRVIPNVAINRLQTWSAVYMGFGVGLPGEPAVINQENNACLLDLDVNTAPEAGLLLPGEALPQLVQELVGLANEIAEKGDHP